MAEHQAATTPPPPAKLLPVAVLLWLAGVYLRIPVLVAPPLAPFISNELALTQALTGALTTLPLLMLAIGIMMSKDGERIGMLGAGRTASFGKKAVARLAEDLERGTHGQFPSPPKSAATIILASDFYAPLADWQARLAPLAAKCPEGVLLAISAPIEESFPFEGRTKLSRPGTESDRILGRAETMREAYLRRFAEQRDGLRRLATQMGWRLVTHTVGQSSLEGAARLKAQVETFGAKA
mgnify:CR=1 FL=1